MQKKLFLALALIIPLLAVGIEQAYATFISGQIKYGGSGISGKATAERVSEYKYDSSDSSGNYDLDVDSTNTYSVSGSKAGYQYVSYSNIDGGDSLDIILPNSRSYTDIKFKVAYDTSTGVTLTEAKSYVTSAEPWFKTEHSIDFVETTASSAWTSNDAGGTDCVNHLLGEMRDDSSWTSGNYGTAEILIGFTDTMTGGTGCINAIPGSGGTHPYIVISTASSDMARTVMHELSHGYGFSHTLSCSNQIPGIMTTDSSNSSCGSSTYIKNWKPADDSTMESKRSWY